MALNSSVPVRFNDVQDARLHAIAERTGLGVSTLIRIATERYLDQIERDGELAIPLAPVSGQYPKHRDGRSAMNEKAERKPKK